MAVAWAFRGPSLCRRVRRELLRNAWLDLTPIIPTTACHQRNYVETYSRFIVNCSFEELNTWLAKYRHETEKPVEDAYKDCLGLAFSHKNKDGAQCWVIWVKECN